MLNSPDNHPLQIFTDASFDRHSGMAVMGYILLRRESEEELTDSQIKELPAITSSLSVETCVRAELLSILVALNSVEGHEGHEAENIVLYTDCKTASDLNSRRGRLEESAYMSKRSGKELPNADLFREFFSLQDRLGFRIHWIAGHSPGRSRTQNEKIFTRVDRLTRKLLRKNRLGASRKSAQGNILPPV